VATTTYTDATMGARAIGARTDSGGTPVTDVSAEEDRYAHVLFGEGKLSADAFVPAAGAGATMDVDFGSGVAKADYYVVAGNDAGQGNYVVRLAAASETVTLAAADGSLPRIDEVYLVVQDNAYDASGNALPRFGLRTGTAAASPAVPGPDAGWDAYVLLASIAVPAAAADIVACTITDERNDSILAMRQATVANGLTVTGDIAVTGNVDGVNVAGHTHDGTADDGPAIPAANLTGLKAAVDAANVDADTLDGIDSLGFVLAAHEGAGGAVHADATGAVAGFMTAAQYTKLAGIATAATANQTITAGGGITVTDGAGAAPTVAHEDTSSAASINTSGATIVDALTLDTYGHITALTTRSLVLADIGAAASSHNHDGDYYQYATGTPRVTITTAAPAGGSNGDIWFRY